MPAGITRRTTRRRTSAGPLADSVESRIGLPTFLERDTNVAVMTEWRYGAAQGADDVIYITVSTGIGGGIVLGRNPIYGLDGTAGEVGHVTVDLDGEKIACTAVLRPSR